MTAADNLDRLAALAASDDPGERERAAGALVRMDADTARALLAEALLRLGRRRCGRRAGAGRPPGHGGRGRVRARGAALDRA